MKKKILIALVSLISTIPPTLFAAHNLPGSATLMLGGGYDYFDAKRRMNSQEINFFTIGYNFTPEWTVEGLLGFFNTRFRNYVNNDNQINGNMISFNAIYRFCPYHDVMQPYLLAGVGVMGFNPNLYDAHNEGNINAGFGLQFFVNEVVSFRVEARDFYTFSGGKNDFFLDAGVNFALNFC